MLCRISESYGASTVNFKRVKREEWLFIAGLATVLITFVISLVGEQTEFKWLATVVSLLVLVSVLGFAMIAARAEERLERFIEARLPETKFIDNATLLAAELKNAVEDADQFISCSGSQGRNSDYLAAIENRIKAGIDYKRILYPDRLNESLLAHVKSVLSNQGVVTISAIEERNLPHLLITEKTALIVIPQPRSGSPVAFRLTRTEKIPLLQNYFTGLSSLATELNSIEQVTAFNQKHTPLSERLQ